MTYEGHSSRRSSRVLQALVVLTIVLVAFWAINGGLEEIPANQTETAAVSG